MLNTHKRATVVGALLSLALLAAACSPTPTPVVLVASIVTATATKPPAQPPTLTPTPTATATEIFIPDDTNSEATPSGTGTPPALDVCDLITDDEVATILGEPVTRAQSGTDDLSEPYPIHFCTWHVATPSIALVLSVTDTGSQGEAVSQLEAHLAANEDDATVEEDVDAEQAGVGERVYWTVSENAAGFDIASGSHVYVLAVGGQVTPTDELRAALLALAQSVSGRL